MENLNTTQWTHEVFGKCDFGDPRRVARLKDFAARQLMAPEVSTFGACEGDRGASEGAYRFLRNDAVNASDIDRGVALSTAELCKSRSGILLAIQDSTSVALANRRLREELEEVGCPTGFMVHSTLMADGDTGEAIGLIDQVRWIRPKDRPGKHTRKERNYEDKESYRWEDSCRRAAELLQGLNNVITVCDREGDIFDFLQYQQEHDSRFIIRASHNRKLSDEIKLWQKMDEMPVLGHRKIDIAQRGPWKQREGRKERTATLEIRAETLTIEPSKTQEIQQSITMNAVCVREISSPPGEDPLIWRLLTSEPLTTLGLATKVIEYYEKRWLIEEFHKCWKVGCRLEERAFQSIAVVDRYLAISAQIGVRLLQFQCMADGQPNKPATKMLTRDELKCLHAMTKAGKPGAKKPRTNKEVYHSLAKLGGWMDTKKTGRVGWQAIWKGWLRFQDRLYGWRLAKNGFSTL